MTSHTDISPFQSWLAHPTSPMNRRCGLWILADPARDLGLVCFAWSLPANHVPWSDKSWPDNLVEHTLWTMWRYIAAQVHTRGRIRLTYTRLGQDFCMRKIWPCYWSSDNLYILFTDQYILDRMGPDHSPREQECNRLFTQCSNTFLPGVVSGVAKMKTWRQRCIYACISLGRLPVMLIFLASFA